jgi:hypothetical protein
MREVEFAYEIEGISKQKHKSIPLHFEEILEEGILYSYVEKHGYCAISPKFNTGIERVPSKFTGVDGEDENTNIPVVIHYYGPSKPQKFVRMYEATGCPSCTDLKHRFWKVVWKYSPWALERWYKYYKEYCGIKSLAGLD